MTPSRALLDAVERLLDLAIDEDLGPVGDVTSAVTLDEKTRGEGTIVAKQKDGLVLCGLFAAERTFARLAPNVRFERFAGDGDRLAKGKIAAKVSGPAREILGAERIALNFLQHLSGVATLTAKFVDAAAGKATVLDTRKTTPGWRALEKFAVACGGGKNNRFGLFDGILIKDNHVEAAGGVKKAIEVEVGSLEQLDEALEASPEMILLDNFDVAGLKACVARVKKSGKGVLLEASGGVTLASIAELAATGVDFVSSGALTHSAPAVDLSLELILAKK